MYRRIVDESRGGSREDEIEKARLAWYEGFVAEEIDRFSASEGGLLTGADMAAWRASDRARRHARVSRADRVQDAAVGGRPRRPAAARAPRGIRPGRAVDGRVRARRSSSAGSSRSRIATRCTATPRTCLSRPCSRGVQRGSGAGLGAARCGGGDVPIRGVDACQSLHVAAVAAGSGEPTVADTVHLDIADRFGKHDLSDAERRVAPELSRDSCSRLAARDAGADVLARRRAARRRSNPVRARERRCPPGSRFAAASRISRGEPPAAISRSSGRCTSSFVTSISG